MFVSQKSMEIRRELAEKNLNQPRYSEIYLDPIAVIMIWADNEGNILKGIHDTKGLLKTIAMKLETI